MNQDYSPNSAATPASRGSTIMIYATGGGAMTSAAIDGQIAATPLAALMQTTTVRIGGMIAPVVYAGAAPSLVNGMLQINVSVPEGITPGDAVPIEITIGDIASPAGVTLAVH